MGKGKGRDTGEDEDRGIRKGKGKGKGKGKRGFNDHVGLLSGVMRAQQTAGIENSLPIADAARRLGLGIIRSVQLADGVTTGERDDKASRWGDRDDGSATSNDNSDSHTRTGDDTDQRNGNAKPTRESKTSTVKRKQYARNSGMWTGKEDDTAAQQHQSRNQDHTVKGAGSKVADQRSIRPIRSSKPRQSSEGFSWRLRLRSGSKSQFAGSSRSMSREHSAAD